MCRPTAPVGASGMSAAYLCPKPPLLMVASLPASASDLRHSSSHLFSCHPVAVAQPPPTIVPAPSLTLLSMATIISLNHTITSLQPPLTAQLPHSWLHLFVPAASPGWRCGRSRW